MSTDEIERLHSRLSVLEAALRRIADTRYSERNEPFDDALDIADAALHSGTERADAVGKVIEAAMLLEVAEDKHANCPACEGLGVPELCELCFPFFDEARVMRRNALALLSSGSADAKAERADAVGKAKAILGEFFSTGTRVTNCLIHSGMDFDDRPHSCEKCATDIRNHLAHAIRVNEFLNSKVDRAKAALLSFGSADAKTDGWRPIETAPKDGTPVDLGFRDSDGEWRIVDCGWMPHAFKGAGAWVNLKDRSIVAPEGPPWVQPTHWMKPQPLPDPPSGSADGSEREGK